MKRRLVKKWTKRYINPLIKEMPRVNFRAMELTHDSDNGLKYNTVGDNHIIVNGRFKEEGERAPNSKGLRKDIINTAYALRGRVDSFKNPRLRVLEINRRYGVYLRIVDFSDWPEGYVYRPYEEEMSRN